MANGFNYTYETGGVPTQKDLDAWGGEFRLFDYQPPEPNAHSEARRRGWGFEPYLKPPPDCYEFVAANLKREWKVNLTDRFRPEARYSILTTLMTYFAWLRTNEGTRWLLHLNGIQIIPPHPGYAYFYKGERLIEPQFGLRIYHVDGSTRTVKSPDEYYGGRLITELKTLFEQRRGPSSRPTLHAGDGMWRWVGSFLRNWLIEREPDRNWPTPKPDRISGYIWARGLLRPGSQTDYVWTALGKTEVYRDSRIYRIQRPAYEQRLVGGVMQQIAPQNPGVIWDDRKHMQTVPLDEVDRHDPQRSQTIEGRYRCRSCGQIRCCTTTKGGTNERLCMNCRGTQLESAERRSLKWCQYRECRRCPEHLRNEEDLINLVSRLNLAS